MRTARQIPSPQGLSDEELVRQLGAGRHESLGRLYRRYAPLIFNMAGRSLDRGAAEEIVQDVFLAVWRNATAFAPGRGAFQLQPDPDGFLLASLADGGPGPEELAWRGSLRPLVESALQELPQPQRRAVDLAFLQDLSHEEVAAELGIPLGTAKTRIRSGLQRMRGKLVPASGA